MTGQPSPSTLRPCPWPGCGRPHRATYLMCREHWYSLPADIRARINETYRPGQTVLTATPWYLEALRDALDYARRAEAGTADDLDGDAPWECPRCHSLFERPGFDHEPCRFALAGPYETEHQARAAAHTVIPPAAGSSILSDAQNRQLLGRALEEADVTMGQFDDRIAGWLAQWEDATVAAIAGWVRRAAARPDAEAAGRRCPETSDGEHTRTWHDGERCTACGQPGPEPGDPSEYRYTLPEDYLRGGPA